MTASWPARYGAPTPHTTACASKSVDTYLPNIVQIALVSGVICWIFQSKNFCNRRAPISSAGNSIGNTAPRPLKNTRSYADPPCTMASRFLIRLAVVAALAAVARAQQGTCGDSDGAGGAAVDDSMCAAAIIDDATTAGDGNDATGARAFARANPTAVSSATDCSATGAPCDLTIAAEFVVCCYIPKCDDAEDANDYVCPLGSKLVDGDGTPAGDDTAAAATDQDAAGAATCCEPKVAADCDFTTDFFCDELAGTALSPCLAGSGLADACNACPSQLNEPSAFATGSQAASCEDNICNVLTVETAAAKGIVIATLAGTEATMTDLALAGAVSAAAGWTFPAGMTDAGTVVVSTCTGTQDPDTDGDGNTDCAAHPAFVASKLETDCPTADGCVFTRAASITCPTATGGDFTVTGAVGMTCIMPTSAEPGTVITNMDCSGGMQTGSIVCSTLHTCDSTTHHASGTGIDIDGLDNLPGNADDGVKCLVEGDPLTLVVADTVGSANAAGCSINVCIAGAPPTGYTAADGGAAAATAVPGLGAVTCTNAGNGDFSLTSTNFWGVATCTGTVDAGVEGKVEGATEDCAAWTAWTRTNQPADCPTGCVYDNTAATVTCAQSSAEGDLTNAFVYTGCTQAKCNDVTGDDNAASSEFSACSKGMTIKGSLLLACADGTCDTWDCCDEDDGCAAIPDPGFDSVSGNDDDGNGPCFGTNSACVDVPAPGVGNTCTCCDGETLASIRSATEVNGGCEGAIGYFGVDVTSTDAASSADVTAVQGSCTACTPVANSAEASSTWAVPAQSGAADVDEADKMVTCTQADDSRAVACVTGSISVDNSANGVSDVCRLECPFTEVVGLIDRLHIHTDKCAEVSLTDGAPTEQQQIASCELVEGCYYTPCVDQAGTGPCGVNAGTDQVATCRPIYAGCNGIAQGGANTQANCAAGPLLSGVDNVLASLADAVVVTSTDDVAACTFSNADGIAGNADDSCLYTPEATAYTNTITRCDALLATNWAHDLRDSCDATRACPLHGAIDATTPGMIAMVKAVYGIAAGTAPIGGDTWAAGAAPMAAGGSGATALTGLGAVSAPAGAYFLNDGDAVAKTDWEVCMGIRDAVLSAPTCAAGAGR